MSTDVRSAALPKPSPNSCIFLVSAVSFGAASTAATRRSRTSGSPCARPCARPCRTRGRAAAAAAGNANCRAPARARIR